MRSLALLLLLTLTPCLPAELRFVKRTYGLGEVPGGPICEAHFDFENIGSTTIEILGVRRDCGCLEPMLSQKTLRPGQTGALGLRVRTLGQPAGQRNWSAWVRYREGEQIEEVRVTLLATIRNDVAVQPAALALHVENQLRQEITVTDRRPRALHLNAARASSAAVQATIVPEGNGVTRVLLDVSGRALQPGRHDLTLILYTDDPQYRELQVPITVTRGGDGLVTATPRAVQVRSAGVSSQLVRLRGGTQQLIVESATCDDPAIGCTWANAPDSGVVLKIRVDAVALRERRADVRVQLGGAAPQTLTIPVVVETESLPAAQK